MNWTGLGVGVGVGVGVNVKVGVGVGVGVGLGVGVWVGVGVSDYLLFFSLAFFSPWHSFALTLPLDKKNSHLTIPLDKIIFPLDMLWPLKTKV